MMMIYVYHTYLINIDEDDYYDDGYGEEDEYYEEEKPQTKKEKKKAEKQAQKQEKEKSNPNKITSTPSQTSSTNPVAKKVVTEPTPAELNSLKYPKMSYPQIAKQDKSDISIVIIGHVDSGKSTLMGHLLFDLGYVDKKALQNNQKGYKKTGTTQFHYAWATDEGTEERERGVTVDIAYKTFETKTKIVTAMDAPGHRDFIPNMITGTSAADAAILVIDSGKSAFDSGFFQGGQTKEHAILAKTLGVKQIIVCVNKIELYNWNKERFDYIKSQVEPFLHGIGFEQNDIYFIPISGLTGDNLINKSDIKTASWYRGPSLLDTIDTLPIPARGCDGPVRFVISDSSFGSVNGLQGFTIFGRVESGVVTEKVEYEIRPNGLKTKIRSISVNQQKVDFVSAGQTAELLLTLDKNSTEEIEVGSVMCSVKYPVPLMSKFKAQIKTLDVKTPISIGQKMFLHLQGQKVQASVKKIIKIYNDNNTTVRNGPIFIPKNFNAIVILECEKPICVEIYNNIKQLGRIALRSEGETIAIGFVQEFI